ncbi:Bug family tripartite tricarboxylate transporter substrate binding protein [Achromobacter piechaudii]|uniref:Bug family tripartite tricarboxylate transporter substrate binding protein n=1 Tax=Achromobacter piechaudii TaxID=72556 RepID=UPI003DA95BC2
MNCNRRNFLRTVGGSAAVALMPSAFSANQSSYPDRTIRLLVPFSAGSSTDIAARTWSEQLAKSLSPASVVVENRAGAGGNIGAAVVAHAAPDGYSLLYSSATTYCISPFVYPDLAYNPERDFAPIAVTISVPVFLVVSGDSDIKSFDDLVKAIKAKPDRHSYGSNGVGTSGHIACRRFASLIGQPDLLHIPYKNGSQGVMADVIGGRITYAVDPWSVVGPQIESGRLRAIGVSSRERLSVAPNVPTLTELLGQDCVVVTWNGLWAPKDVSPEIIARLHAAMDEGRSAEGLAARFEGQGTPLMPRMTLEQTRKFMAEETQRWKSLVELTGVRITS